MIKKTYLLKGIILFLFKLFKNKRITVIVNRQDNRWNDTLYNQTCVCKTKNDQYVVEAHTILCGDNNKELLTGRRYM